MTALQLHDHLLVLRAERAAASLDGLDNEGHLADLRVETEMTERAFVGAAVTEIASFRAQLRGPQVG
jgi:hypothetical protein